MVAVLRCLVALIAFFLLTCWGYWSGEYVYSWALDLFPPIIGSPSADPAGRAVSSAAAAAGMGPFLCVLYGIVGGWLALLWTYPGKWSKDLTLATPLFLVFSSISIANYTQEDVIYTREAQAVLDLLLIPSGAVITMMLQETLKNIKSALFVTFATMILSFCTWAFVAVPLWYSISFLSWKLGAGELKSFDAAAKAVGAAASLIAIVGLQWKNGTLTRIKQEG